jgi:(1->4)-alpha-D-glucan 1-alpha-D-glucosylmutase
VPVPSLVATYRVQLTAGFGFAEATRLLDHLVALGVSHVYCSPYLAAAAGSTHGYDVVDHDRVNAELGGEAGRAAFVAALRDRGLGQLVDVVPNHMSVADRANRWWHDVLRHGRASEFADFFDIDWSAGRVLLPVLGEPIGEAIAAGDLVVDAVRGEARYHERAFPLAPGTYATGGGDDPLAVLARQHYRLAWWRLGTHELNYRRFFDVTELAGVRVEDPRVFAAVHRRVLEWVADGDVSGLRVDHPDGLRDPGGYVAELRRRAGDVWIVVEKILEPGEELPGSWPVDGTTGYDALQLLTSVFVDPEAEDPITRAYVACTGDARGFAEIVTECKQLVLRELFAPDVDRVTAALRAAADTDPAGTDLPTAMLRRAVEATVVAMPVYRTYVTAQRADAGDVAIVERAVAAAACAAPDVDARAFTFLGRVLRGEHPSDHGADALARFQQLSGPAMAKGVEDTAYYRFNRLACLNEVGGDPAGFGLSPRQFHAAAAMRAERGNRSMIASTTHDTKRSEDARLRLAVLSQMPERWTTTVARWHASNRAKWDGATPDLSLEHLLYQTLVAAHPLPAERAHQYVEKAMREAKQRTSWLHPEPSFETAAHGFVDALAADDEFCAELDALVAEMTPAAAAASLAHLVLKCTLPGIPDFFQGAEAALHTLVDPDNRTPVDHAAHAAALAALAGAPPPPARDLDAAKMWLTQRLLHLRRERVADMTGGYTPLTVDGPDSTAAVAFRRGVGTVVLATVRPVRTLSLGWRGTLHLPPGEWSAAIGAPGRHSGTVALAAVAGPYHANVLVRAGEVEGQG